MRFLTILLLLLLHFDLQPIIVSAHLLEERVKRLMKLLKSYHTASTKQVTSKFSQLKGMCSLVPVSGTYAGQLNRCQCS